MGRWWRRSAAQSHSGTKNAGYSVQPAAPNSNLLTLGRPPCRAASLRSGWKACSWRAAELGGAAKSFLSVDTAPRHEGRTKPSSPHPPRSWAALIRPGEVQNSWLPASPSSPASHSFVHSPEVLLQKTCHTQFEAKTQNLLPPRLPGQPARAEPSALRVWGALCWSFYRPPCEARPASVLGIWGVCGSADATPVERGISFLLKSGRGASHSGEMADPQPTRAQGPAFHFNFCVEINSGLPGWDPPRLHPSLEVFDHISPFGFTVAHDNHGVKITLTGSSLVAQW